MRLDPKVHPGPAHSWDSSREPLNPTVLTSSYEK